MTRRGRSAIGEMFLLISASCLLLGVSPAQSQKIQYSEPPAPMPSMPNMPYSPIQPPVLQPSLPTPTMPAMPTPDLGALDDENLTTTFNTIVDLYKAGKYDDAMPLAKAFLSSIEKRYGNDTTSYAAAISVLARLYQAQGQFAVAETYVKRALAIDERELEPQHTNIAGDLVALGQLYQDQGRLDEAEPLFKRALAIHEANALDAPDVGRVLNNLAWLYQEQGRYTEAEPLIKRSLSIIEKALGPTDADFGRSLDTLAKIYEGEGRIQEAEPLYQRALKILEDALGPEHESVAASRENLGGLVKSLGRLAEAEPLLKMALKTKERVYGLDHPNIANSLSQLGDLYRLEERFEEAEAQFQRALTIRKATIREVPVYFATDRTLAKDKKSITFGVEQTEVLTFGEAMIMVSKPEALRGRGLYNSPLSNSKNSRETSHIETTEVARLAIRKIEVRTDLRYVQQRLAEATVFPKQVFVFVHGFNVSFENALRRTAQIAYDLNFDSAPFLFSWPSRGGMLNYFSDRDNAVTAANHLKSFLEKLVAETGATKVHLIAHSMGNVVLLDALEKMKFSIANQSDFRFAEIILHSPDVSKNRFSQLMTGIKGIGASATLYASQSDRALNISAWIWGERAGAAPAIVDGVETIDTTAAGSSFLGLNHDLYVTNPAIFNDMRLILELGRHPPDQRSPAFQATATADGTYWLYRRPTQMEKLQPSNNTEAVSLTKPSSIGQDRHDSDNKVIEPAASQADGFKSTVDDLARLQAELNAALTEARASKLAWEETRQLLEQERAAKQDAEQASRELRASTEAAVKAAVEARQKYEVERSARLKAESDALLSTSQKNREMRSRELDQVERGNTPDSAAATATTAQEPEKSEAGAKSSAPLPSQAPPIVEPAQNPPSTETAPVSPTNSDGTNKKPVNKPLKKAGSANKRRPASSTSENKWPFSEWN